MPTFYPVAGQDFAIGGVVTDKNTPYSQTDFSGLTFTTVSSWSQAANIGQNRQSIDAALINSEWDATVKGTRQPIEMAYRFLLNLTDAGQIALKAAEQSNEFFGFRITGNDLPLGSTKAVTATIASPGVFTSTSHGYANGTTVSFSSTGILPGGIIAGQVYYVINQATSTFQVALTPGGSAIATTGVQVGTHTVQSVGSPTTIYFPALVMSADEPEGEANTARYLEATLRRRASIVRIPAIAAA